MLDRYACESCGCSGIVFANISLMASLVSSLRLHGPGCQSHGVLFHFRDGVITWFHLFESEQSAGSSGRGVDRRLEACNQACIPKRRNYISTCPPTDYSRHICTARRHVNSHPSTFTCTGGCKACKCIQFMHLSENSPLFPLLLSPDLHWLAGSCQQAEQHRSPSKLSLSSHD